MKKLTKYGLYVLGGVSLLGTSGAGYYQFIKTDSDRNGKIEAAYERRESRLADLESCLQLNPDASSECNLVFSEYTSANQDYNVVKEEYSVGVPRSGKINWWPILSGVVGILGAVGVGK